MMNSTISSIRASIQFFTRCAILFTATLTIAQDNVELRPNLRDGKPTPELRAVRVQEDVKPAFLISPLVHRLQARRGQLIRFEFEVESNKRASRLEIRPVSMTQQDNGVIMPDDAAPAPQMIQLLSPSSIDLTESEKHVITAQMRVPVTNAPFLSYGILAKEIPLDGPASGTEDEKARVGIRFVTQYLLRVDVDVLGVRGDSVAALELYDGQLIAEKGLSLTRIFAHNPTETAMEFGVECQLLTRGEQSVGKPFGLVVPVRAGQDPPERFNCRILPGARLRLEEFLPHPVFSGDYSLSARLTHQGRTIRTVQFPVTIHDGQFPAQDAAIVRVARDISVEPASVELSLQRGGNRISSLSITNQSLQRVIVESQAIPMQGFLHESLRIKPSTFQLEPNRTRKVLVMLEGGSSFDEHSYAFAEITVRPEIGEAIGSHRVPVCVLTDSKSQPQISPGELVWKATPASAGFAIPVTNRGLRHVPLEGRLSLVDGFGRGLVTEAGYGKWLLPGESSELFFGFRQPPPPGTYTVRAEISQGESLPPLQMQQTLQLSTMLQESMSTSKATPKTNVE